MDPEVCVKSTIHKRSLEIAGHKTSVSLEDEFWSALKEIARDEGVTVFDMTTRIDNGRAPKSNLSSAIRLFVLDHYIRRQFPPGVATLPDEQNAPRD